MSIALQHQPVSLCDINAAHLHSVRRAVRAVLVATALCAGLVSPVAATTLGTVTVIGYAPSGGGAGGWGGGSNWTYAPEENWIVVQEECTLVEENGAKFLTGCSHVYPKYDVPNNHLNPNAATCRHDEDVRMAHAGSDIAPWYNTQWDRPNMGSILTVEFDDGSHENYRLDRMPGTTTEASGWLTRISGTLRDCPK